MINLCDLGQVYLVYGKTDLRKGIDGLACLIKEQFQLDPFGSLLYEQVDRLMNGFAINPKIKNTKARSFY
ncbi:transposase ORF_A [Lactobacillus amylovorus GRL1118]|uniref:IS66 family insertion sequence element accessory protein TnpB n=1 Tax=Lactobacillus amylovorus TaxID=1604 RepID=UPI00020165E8|nr:IS66 family insertion sequence element accessory protein TnpB [Lactobacillus amylovorus]AEA32238.1 transposase ORF_A [Lactobacillus amylovorus GRL1118]